MIVGSKESKSCRGKLVFNFSALAFTPEINIFDQVGSPLLALI